MCHDLQMNKYPGKRTFTAVGTGGADFSAAMVRGDQEPFQMYAWVSFISLKSRNLGSGLRLCAFRRILRF